MNLNPVVHRLMILGASRSVKRHQNEVLRLTDIFTVVGKEEMKDVSSQNQQRQITLLIKMMFPSVCLLASSHHLSGQK